MAEGSSSSHGVDPHRLEDNWRRLRARVQEKWPQLTEQELTMIDGDSRKLVALVHQRTGDDISHIEKEIDEIAASSEGLLERLRQTSSNVGDMASRYVGEPVMNAYGSAQKMAAQAPVSSTGIALLCGTLIGLLIGSSMCASQPRRREWW